MSFLSKTDKLLGSATRILGGETVQFFPKSGGRIDIQGVFDNEASLVDPDTERLVTSTQPILGIRLRDLDKIPLEGDEVVVRGERFKVVDIREDGLGGASLFISRVSNALSPKDQINTFNSFEG